ncbi:MAG: hypothetical protein A3F09_00860 [Chlamydiae bacterium RIFCSPHIGHO2_12_FULL_49_11]|nr:MAG: hypothetical protein A3F09_00860 [Chlamydiae bacterium RIFCSPHIGHO2_12_FULL_49_11]
MKRIFAFIVFGLALLRAETDHKLLGNIRAARRGVEGWCSEEKTRLIVETILSAKPEVCVEIGVFGGASILPIAMSLKTLGKGKVYAIDPWTNVECLKGQDKPNADWWGSVNLEQVFQSYNRMISHNNLSGFVQTLRMTSEDAAGMVSQEIDLLHIDGNHSTDAVKIDVEVYFPRVKMGGYVLCDDWLWSIDHKYSTRPIYETMLSKCEFIAKVDKGNCVLLRKVEL